jgi:prophage tail gpP-like protein
MPVNIAGYWTSESLARISNIPIDETCTIIIEGTEYRSWKTVRVNLEVGRAFQEFEVTVAEPVDVITPNAAWQIHVGASCDILLAGIKVISGTVEIRQTAYDAHNHGLMLYGRSFEKDAADGSVQFPPGEDTQIIDGDFQTIMTRALQGTGVGLMIKNVQSPLFKNFSINFGEGPWHVGERLARFIPGLRITGDGFGNWIAQQLSQADPGDADFVEGQNILAMHATIDITPMIGHFDARSQTPNQDDSSPSSAAEVRATLDDSSVGASYNRQLMIPCEEPSTQEMCTGRVRQEWAYRTMEIVFADVTVHGWLSKGGVLFGVRLQYGLYSPMADLSRNDLWSRKVVFQQGDAGTTTTIELCTAESLGGGFSALPLSGTSQYYGQGVTPGQAANAGRTLQVTPGSGSAINATIPGSTAKPTS